MEKRAILAFVLCFIILIGWAYLFGPDKDQAHKQDKATTPAGLEKTQEHRETGQADKARDIIEHPDKDHDSLVVSDSSTKLEKEMPAEKEIRVETPLYRAVFTTAGPSLKSFKLKKYHKTKDSSSPLVELSSLKEGQDHFFFAGFHNPSVEKSAETTFEVDKEFIELQKGASSEDLVFHTTTPQGLDVTKTFRFYPDQYRISLDIEVRNSSDHALSGSFSTSLRARKGEEKSRFYSFVGLALLVNDEVEELDLEEVPDQEIIQGDIKWAAYEDDYFISAVIPEAPGRAVFQGRLDNSGILEGIYSGPSISLNPYEKASNQYGLYFGPRDLGTLKEQGEELSRAVSFGWTDIIAKPLLYVLRFFNGYIHNYGVSIIILTILIKILFWPLTHKSYKSMKEMQKLQPRMAKIREKYKNDKQKLNQEMMALYKTYKVNPMSGCLPMIIQIPVFLALFRILGSAIELRHASFMLWIDDLSAPDRLFNFPFDVPLMSPPTGIPVLTLLMGASMLLQQKMTPTPGDPTQAKIMMFLPIIFTFVFINFPSGLVLYWLVNNILSIGQQYRIHKASP